MMLVSFSNREQTVFSAISPQAIAKQTLMGIRENTGDIKVI
ncbi:MAG: hypothetical protein AAGE84_01035 [Cyanobacteria bacterium P01_G01_bin.39]